jgi:hypothetical protein
LVDFENEGYIDFDKLKPVLEVLARNTKDPEALNVDLSDPIQVAKDFLYALVKPSSHFSEKIPQVKFNLSLPSGANHPAQISGHGSTIMTHGSGGSGHGANSSSQQKGSQRGVTSSQHSAKAPSTHPIGPGFHIVQPQQEEHLPTLNQ